VNGGAIYRPHPGPARVPRRVAAPGAEIASFWVDLTPGEELFRECKLVAEQFSGDAVLFRFSAVELDGLALHFVEDGAADQMVRYGEPLRITSPAMLVAAHMTVGWDHGRPLPHAHGYVATSDGKVLGGHLSPGTCILSTKGSRAQALLTVVKGCGLFPEADGETGFRLLSPGVKELH
jgi:predicted DNA-binding protein with PD1-like motif